MKTMTMLGALVLSSAAFAADIDRTIADFRTPAEIRWVRNPAGTNEQAILFGDPSKPGPSVARIKWLPGNEEVEIQVWGMGPATATPAEKK